MDSIERRAEQRRESERRRLELRRRGMTPFRNYSPEREDTLPPGWYRSRSGSIRRLADEPTTSSSVVQDRNRDHADYHPNHNRSPTLFPHRQEAGPSRIVPDQYGSSGQQRHQAENGPSVSQPSAANMKREIKRETIRLITLKGGLKDSFVKWLAKQVSYDKGKRSPTKIEKLPEDIKTLYDNFLKKVEGVEMKLKESKENKGKRYLLGDKFNPNEGSLMKLLHEIRIVGNVFLNYSFGEELLYIWSYLFNVSKEERHTKQLKSDQEIIREYKKILGIEEITKTTEIPEYIQAGLKSQGLITDEEADISSA